jgi:hypothetical protein
MLLRRLPDIAAPVFSRQRIADLSFGTMNLDTMVKNNALVKDQLRREWKTAAHSLR